MLAFSCHCRWQILAPLPSAQHLSLLMAFAAWSRIPQRASVVASSNYFKLVCSASFAATIWQALLASWPLLCFWMREYFSSQ